MAKHESSSSEPKLPKRTKGDVSLGDIAGERIAAKRAMSKDLVLQLIDDYSHALRNIRGNVLLSVKKNVE